MNNKGNDGFFFTAERIEKKYEPNNQVNAQFWQLKQLLCRRSS